jgi:hypothetical protein
LEEFGNFQPITTAHSFCEISVQHVSWCEMENIAIKLRLSKVLLQFTEKEGDDCFDVIYDFVDRLL